jgi:hypothetical protein
MPVIALYQTTIVTFITMTLMLILMTCIIAYTMAQDVNQQNLRRQIQEMSGTYYQIPELKNVTQTITYSYYPDEIQDWSVSEVREMQIQLRVLPVNMQMQNHMMTR